MLIRFLINPRDSAAEYLKRFVGLRVKAKECNACLRRDQYPLLIKLVFPSKPDEPSLTEVKESDRMVEGSLEHNSRILLALVEVTNHCQVTRHSATCCCLV